MVMFPIFVFNKTLVGPVSVVFSAILIPMKIPNIKILADKYNIFHIIRIE